MGAANAATHSLHLSLGLKKGSNFFQEGRPSRIFGGALCQTTKIWDNIAQQIILEEAGAIYTDFWGKPMDYAQPLAKAAAKFNFTFCTASLTLHRQLQQLIHS